MSGAPPSDGGRGGGGRGGGGRGGRNRNRRGGRGGGRGGGGGGGGGAAGSGARWNPAAMSAATSSSSSSSAAGAAAAGGGPGSGPNAQWKPKEGWEADRGDGTYRGKDGQRARSNRSGHKFRGRHGLTAEQQRGGAGGGGGGGGGRRDMGELKRAVAPASGDEPGAQSHYQRRARGGGRGYGGRGGRGGGGFGGRGRGPRNKFPEYWGRDLVDEGLAAGAVFIGALRVNPHNRKEAYATCEGLPMDVFLDGQKARNRAFDGDRVIIALLPKEQWKQLSEPKALHDDDDDSAAAAAASAAAGASADRDEDDLHEDEDEDEDDEDEEEIVDVSAAAGVVATLAAEIAANPNLQPAGRVVAIHEARHNYIQIGVLKVPESNMRECFTRDSAAPRGGGAAPGRKGGDSGAAGAAAAGGEDGAADDGEDGGVSSEPLPANVRFVVFSPMDQKMPRILVPVSQVPADFVRQPAAWLARLVQVDIQHWRAVDFQPQGQFKRVIGEAGDIEAETLALLTQYGIDAGEFPAEALADLPVQEGESWSIPPEELARRRDLRKTCIFTIDPATARDLDDALHITRLPDGNYEIGVHIADVSFFVTPGTKLDDIARERSTSVYLTQRVIPMLPRVLCEDLCSLNPGVDRLAFSCIVQVRPTGEPIPGTEWFGRTVIRSCVKLPYAFAQGVIDGRIKEDWQEAADWLVEELHMMADVEALPADSPRDPPSIRELFSRTVVYPDEQSGFAVTDCIKAIRELFKVSRIMRKRRFDLGSMALHNVKLAFHLDTEGNPLEAFAYTTKEANNLVEEFMLLANRTVAQRLVDEFPDRAVLRNHQAPNPRKLAQFGDLMKVLGFQLNAGSSKAFNASMESIKSELGAKDADIFQCLQMLAVRAMQQAKYLSTTDTDPSEWAHYALAMPVYTHFTSPIRRYPDILAHRQLQAALTKEAIREGTMAAEDEQARADMRGVLKPAELQEACELANEAKTASRRAQEQSGDVYLCVLMHKRPTMETAVCVGVGERFLNVIVPRYGIEGKVYMMDMNIIGSVYDKGTETVHIYWPKKPNTAGPVVGRKVPTLAVGGSGERKDDGAGRRKRLTAKQQRAEDKARKKKARADRRAAQAAAALEVRDADGKLPEKKAEDVEDDDDDENASDASSSSSSGDEDEAEPDEMYDFDAGGMPAGVAKNALETQDGHIHVKIKLLSRLPVTIRKKPNRIPIEVQMVPVHPAQTAEDVGASLPASMEDTRDGVEAVNDFEERH